MSGFARVVLVLCWSLSIPAMLFAQSVADPAAILTWQQPDAATVRGRVWKWLDQQQPDQTVLKQAEQLWPAGDKSLAGAALLERCAAVLALAHPQAREVVEACSHPGDPHNLPDFAWLHDPQTSPLLAGVLRLWAARWLCQQGMYDEAQGQLANLQPEDSIDPASLLFYQSVTQHWALDKEAGLRSLARLLEQRGRLPRRYETLAILMQADLTALDEESLDHISRRMDDVRRRLELARPGAKTLEVEDGVIASLDKLIEKLESQAQQVSLAGGKMQAPSKPADESRPLGGKGPGAVAKKNIGHKGGWGDLPPKEREEVLQAVDKDFPSHYREIIENYFRRLANQGAEE